MLIPANSEIIVEFPSYDAFPVSADRIDMATFNVKSRNLFSLSVMSKVGIENGQTLLKTDTCGNNEYRCGENVLEYNDIMDKNRELFLIITNNNNFDIKVTLAAKAYARDATYGYKGM